MKQINFDTLLFRCSQLSKLMTEPQTKEAKARGDLSEGCKTHLIDVYVQNVYGRKTDIKNKYVEKGNAVEEDSITLYSRIKGTFFKKNEQHLSNEFIKGTPDIYEGESIHTATRITDTKSSWDAFTFFRVSKGELDKDYDWQLQGYMYLTPALIGSVAYCLNNTPANLINDEKRKLGWAMGCIDCSNDQTFIDGCKQIEINSIYDLATFKKHYPNFEFHNNTAEWSHDIPMHQRLIEFEVERDINKQAALYKRIIKCREYLKELHEGFMFKNPELTTIVEG